MTTNTTLKPIAGEDQVDLAPKERRCLKCGGRFASHSFGERICKQCKSSNSWRAGLR